MRVTVEKDYKIVEHVLLDGNAVEQCVEADDELGFVIVNKTDENGIVAFSGNTSIKEIKLGKVEIILKGFGEVK